MRCQVCRREFHSPCSDLVSVCSHCIARGASTVDAALGRGAAAVPHPAFSREPFDFVGKEDLTDLFPEFEIGECLGIGGMGVVFRAHQKSLERPVAIKILDPKLLGDPEFEGRFEREAKTMAMLDHPNIVGIHDFGVRGTYHFLVMEYVEGRDLQELLHSGSLEPGLAFSIIRQVCDGLHHAHQKGVVHRDVKPGNILVGRNGVTKVSDFGLARIVRQNADASLTTTNAGMGTPVYIAPEQLNDARSSDARSDIFALGVVVYEMLTGSRPSGNFPAPTSRLPRRNRRLDEAILRAMDPDPANRLSDLRELSKIVADSTPSNRAVTPGSARIRPLLVAGMWLLIAALVVAGGWVGWRLQGTPEMAGATASTGERSDHFEAMPPEAFLPTAAFPFDPAFDSARRRGGALKQWSSSGESHLFLEAAAGMDDLVSLDRLTYLTSGWMGIRSDGRNVSNFLPLNSMSGITHSSLFFHLRWDQECMHRRRHHVVRAVEALPDRAVDLTQTNDFSVLVTPEKQAVFVSAPEWLPLVSRLEKELESVNDVVSVDSWGFTFALLRESGEVLAWNLQTGIFSEPGHGGPFHQVAAGEAHIVALGRDRKLYAWSSHPYAGHEHVQRSLRVPEHENTIVRVKSFARINTAQREDGSWIAWGDDDTGLIEKINSLGPVPDLAVFGKTGDTGATLAWIEPRQSEPGEGEWTSAQRSTAPPSLEKLLPKAGLRGTDEYERMRRRGGILRRWSEIPGLVDIEAAAGIDDLVFVERAPHIGSTWYAARSNGEMVSSQPELGSRSDYRRAKHSFFIEWPDRLVPSPPPSGREFLALLDPTPRASDLAQSYDAALVVTPGGRLAFGATDSWVKSNRYVLDRLDGLENVVAVEARIRQFAVLTAEGKAHCWIEPHGFFDPPEDERKLVQVSAGLRHLIGLYEDGAVATWGHPDNLRHPRVVSALSVPPDLGPIIRVEAFDFANAVQRPDGSWIAWGDDEGRGMIDQVNSIGPALDFEFYFVNPSTSAKMIWIEPVPLPGEAAQNPSTPLED